jgi:hypothetical protein
MQLIRIKDYRMRLALGQLYCVGGLIGLIASGAFAGDGVLGLFMDESRALDFLKGFLTGLSSALLGMSVVFSVAALHAIKNKTAV